MIPRQRMAVDPRLPRLVVHQGRMAAEELRACRVQYFPYALGSTVPSGVPVGPLAFGHEDKVVTKREVIQSLLELNSRVIAALRKDGVGYERVIYVTTDSAGSSSGVMLNMLRNRGNLERKGVKSWTPVMQEASGRRRPNLATAHLSTLMTLRGQASNSRGRVSAQPSTWWVRSLSSCFSRASVRRR